LIDCETLKTLVVPNDTAMQCFSNSGVLRGLCDGTMRGECCAGCKAYRDYKEAVPFHYRDWQCVALYFLPPPLFSQVFTMELESFPKPQGRGRPPTRGVSGPSRPPRGVPIVSISHAIFHHFFSRGPGTWHGAFPVIRCRLISETSGIPTLGECRPVLALGDNPLQSLGFLPFGTIFSGVAAKWLQPLLFFLPGCGWALKKPRALAPFDKKGHGAGSKHAGFRPGPKPCPPPYSRFEAAGMSSNAHGPRAFPSPHHAPIPRLPSSRAIPLPGMFP